MISSLIALALIAGPGRCCDSCPCVGGDLKPMAPAYQSAVSAPMTPSYGESGWKPGDHAAINGQDRRHAYLAGTQVRLIAREPSGEWLVQVTAPSGYRLRITEAGLSRPYEPQAQSPAPAAAPTYYLADDSGFLWYHSDPAHLRRHVAATNAARRSPIPTYYGTSVPTYYGTSGYLTPAYYGYSAGTCANGSCR